MHDPFKCCFDPVTQMFVKLGHNDTVRHILLSLVKLGHPDLL